MLNDKNVSMTEGELRAELEKWQALVVDGWIAKMGRAARIKQLTDELNKLQKNTIE